MSKHSRDDHVADEAPTRAQTTGGTTATTTDARQTDTRHTGARHPEDHHTHDRQDDVPTAHERFGGMNWGAAFFGWLVAVALTVLLTGIVGAVVAAVDQNTAITQDDAERAAGTITLVAAVVLIAVLAIAYFTGGYVAGRMSRFDGGRQGLGVWIVGLVVTLIALALGVVFGQQYDVLDRVDLPRLPIPTEDLGTGGILTAAVILVVTALAAMLGGGVGRRYHAKVDKHLAV